MALYHICFDEKITEGLAPCSECQHLGRTVNLVTGKRTIETANKRPPANAKGKAS